MPRLTQLSAPDSQADVKQCRIRRSDYCLILRSGSLKLTKELMAEKNSFF
jgi:hypothetical protein